MKPMITLTGIILAASVNASEAPEIKISGSTNNDAMHYVIATRDGEDWRAHDGYPFGPYDGKVDRVDRHPDENTWFPYRGGVKEDSNPATKEAYAIAQELLAYDLEINPRKPIEIKILNSSSTKDQHTVKAKRDGIEWFVHDGHPFGKLDGRTDLVEKYPLDGEKEYHLGGVKQDSSRSAIEAYHVGDLILSFDKDLRK
ncbi:hypothetical protein H6504_05125 [Candidatus Woesearchaeota archaeon]|nr:hypothetical protein [Candidatus Woesearchaeota archaeon]